LESQGTALKTILVAVRELLTKGCADPGQIVHSAQRSGNGLEALRAGLELVRGNIIGWSHFIGHEPVEQLVFAVEDADVRPEKLVSRAGQEVAIQLLHMDGFVR